MCPVCSNHLVFCSTLVACSSMTCTYVCERNGHNSLQQAAKQGEPIGLEAANSHLDIDDLQFLDELMGPPPVSGLDIGSPPELSVSHNLEFSLPTSSSQVSTVQYHLGSYEPQISCLDMTEQTEPSICNDSEFSLPTSSSSRVSTVQSHLRDLDPSLPITRRLSLLMDVTGLRKARSNASTPRPCQSSANSVRSCTHSVSSVLDAMSVSSYAHSLPTTYSSVSSSLPVTRTWKHSRHATVKHVRRLQNRRR